MLTSDTRPHPPALDCAPQSRRIRVCHVSPTLMTGGLERLLVDFARHHDRERFDLTFVSLTTVGPPGGDIRETGCQVLAPPSGLRGRLGLIRWLTSFFRQQRFDVVHTHNALPHLYASLAARRAGVPVVLQTRHGRRFAETWKERLQFAFASRLADRIVAVSSDTADLCRSRGWLGPESVETIRNGIDVDRFAFHGPADRPAAISVARLSAEKDFVTMLRAVRQVIQRVPDFRLQIVGDGPERTRLKELAYEINVERHVEFCGERSDVPELLARAGLFLLSSQTEGIPLTVLEAMAVGLPVVATAVGGLPEIVAPGVTGWLVPPRDPEALATAIVAACAQRSYWPVMARAARQRAEQEFSVAVMLRRYEALCMQLLASRQFAV